MDCPCRLLFDGLQRPLVGEFLEIQGQSKSSHADRAMPELAVDLGEERAP